MLRFNSKTAALLALVAATKGDSLTPLDESASELELKWQPVMDFDTDSCYNTAAIGSDGTLNPGLQHVCTGITENCDQVNRLWNSNVYSRARCNNGVCAIMYEYYFEKDVVSGACVGSDEEGGHRHDWENVVVFVDDDLDNGSLRMVAGSCHGGYDEDFGSGAKSWTETPQMEGDHPKMVYHKHNARTHCFRVAKEDGSDEPPENGEGVWYRSALIGWDNWPGEAEGYPLFYDMVDNWSGGIGPKWTDEKFGENLAKAQGSMFPEFDPHTDG